MFTEESLAVSLVTHLFKVLSTIYSVVRSLYGMVLSIIHVIWKMYTCNKRQTITENRCVVTGVGGVVGVCGGCVCVCVLNTHPGVLLRTSWNNATQSHFKYTKIF